MPDGAAAGMARPPATTADGCRTRASHGSSLVVPEAVPHAMDRLQVVRLARIGLELAADVLHVRVGRALVRLERDAADRGGELRAREDRTGPTRERGGAPGLRARGTHLAPAPRSRQ